MNFFHEWDYDGDVARSAKSDDYSLNNGTQSLESDWTFLSLCRYSPVCLDGSCCRNVNWNSSSSFFFAPHSSDTITSQAIFGHLLLDSALTVARTYLSLKGPHWSFGQERIHHMI